MSRASAVDGTIPWRGTGIWIWRITPESHARWRTSVQGNPAPPLRFEVDADRGYVATVEGERQLFVWTSLTIERWRARASGRVS
jgi:hypothetical protein